MHDGKVQKAQLKLNEMKFQYQHLIDNYSRLMNKCSFSMLILCIILGVIAGDEIASITCLEKIVLGVSVLLSIISLGLLFGILVGYRQPFIHHQQIVNDDSNYDTMTLSLALTNLCRCDSKA